MNLDAEILKALRSSNSGWVSGADLADALKVTRAAIWARIEDLRRLGYAIEASPHQGYQLKSAPDALHADDLLARLGSTRAIGRDIRVFRSTGSTNDVAEKLARDGASEGVVVFAESQTLGRGRLGRAWASPGGLGLWFSVLLRPQLRPPEATRITVAAAVAVRRAILDETGQDAAIKWPNDLLLDQRKVCGILTEMHAEPDRIRHLILGIGVDVNQQAGDFPPDLRKTATSLRLAAGRPLDRAALATRILRELDHDYARVQNGKFDVVAEEWESACVTLGRNVTIQLGSRKVEGRAESLDDDGALLIRTQHGHLERVTGGDVTLETSK